MPAGGDHSRRHPRRGGSDRRRDLRGRNSDYRSAAELARPVESIEIFAKKFGERVLVGAGTVLDPTDVGRVWDAGGRIIVSPDTNTDVIAATAAAGLVSCARLFHAIRGLRRDRSRGDRAETVPRRGAQRPAALKAQLAVLPKDVPILIVGGVKPDNMQPWLDAGATGFGLGGGLYQQGQSPEDTLQKARAYVAGLKS